MKNLRFFIFTFMLSLLRAPLLFGFEVDKKTARDIEARIDQFGPETIGLRRELHMNPELGNREVKTAELLSSKLRSLGLEVKTGVAGTGVVALLRGRSEGPTIAVRADMDALPIEEQTGLEYQSRNKGVMHACGHDVHMSVALGAAYALSGLKDRFQGNIKFIFQPAEEGAPPGEEGGASLMIKENVLEDPTVRAIFGMHVWPDTAGDVFFTEGPIMANSDWFEATLIGKNAHGARPHEGVDAVVLAAETVLSFQSVISRGIDPTDPAVLTIGRINGGARSNIIADRVVLEGTVRTLSEVNRARIPELMESLLKRIASAHGGDYAFTYEKRLPAVINHPELARLMLPTVKSLLGENRVHGVKPQFVSEDFAYYGRVVPGFFFFLGVNDPAASEAYPLHSPKFSPDERAIPVGIRIMTHLLLDGLRQQAAIGKRTPES